MSEYTDRFNCSDLLAWGKAKHAGGVQTGYTDNRDELDTLLFEVPNGSVREMREWLYANRLHDSDFDTPWRNYAGPWRLVKVEDKANRDFVQLFVTIGRGYYTSANWESARLLPMERDKTNSSTSGVTSGSSDNPGVIYTILFPYCDPHYANAIAASLNDGSYSDPVVGTQTLSGTFHNIFSAVTQSEDGTCSVVLTLAANQYVLEAYRDAGGRTEQDVIHLWNVPKDMAQSIIDGWRIPARIGASAHAEHNDKSHTVNLTLSTLAAAADTDSFAWINSACDTKTRVHYGFSLSKAEADAFIALHDTLPPEDISPAPTYGAAGFTRRVGISINGSTGLYDVSIEETWVEYDANKHLFEVVVFDGTNSTAAIENGWHVPLTALETLKAAFDTTVQADNIRTTFEVTRKDNCTFDYKASKTVFTANSKTISASGTGIEIEHVVYRASTESPEPTSNRRERVDISAQLNDHGSLDATVVTKTVKNSTDTADTGPEGVRNRIYAGVNADPGTVDTLITAEGLESAIRKDVRIDLSPKDDDTIDYKVSVREVLEATDSATTGENGIKETVFSGANVDQGDLSDLITDESLGSDKRKRVVLDLSPKDDGSFDYRVKINEVQETTGILPSENYQRGRKQYHGSNADELPDFAETDVVLSASVNGNEDGTFDYSILCEDGSPQEEEVTDGRTILRAYTNQSAIELAGGEKIRGGSVKVGPDGKIDALLTLHDTTAEGASADGIKSGEVLATVTSEVHREDDPDNKPTKEPVDGETINVDFDLDPETGKANWRKSVEVESEKDTGELIVGTAKDVGTLQVKDGAPVMPSTATPAAGHTVEIRGQRKNNGLYAWYKLDVEESEKTVTATAKTQTGNLKIAVAVTFVDGAATAPVTSAAHVPGVLEEFHDVRQKSNGLYSYVKVVTTYALVVPSHIIKSADFREKYRDVVFSKYFYQKGAWYGVVRDYYRDVSSKVTRVYTFEPPTISPSHGENPSDTLVEVAEIARGVWAEDTTEVVYDDWTEDGLVPIMTTLWS